jgi:two-component system, response regulator
MPAEAIEVVLIEDSLADVELAVHSLQQNHLANHIKILRDGEEALDYIFCRGEYAARSITDMPKVILLDIKLPKVDGLEVLRALKADPRTKLIPVVVLTSSAEQRDMVESYELGVSSYIVKPVDFQQFSESIRILGLYWLVLNSVPDR